MCLAGVTIVCPVGDVGMPVLGKSTYASGCTTARPRKTIQSSGDTRTCIASLCSKPLIYALEGKTSTGIPSGGGSPISTGILYGGSVPSVQSGKAVRLTKTAAAGDAAEAAEK